MASSEQPKAAQYRVRSPRAERRHPWLAYLFDLYARIDESVADALESAARVAPEIPCGCSRGCHGCCHQIVPATSLEAAGIAWYVAEEMPASLRSGLAKRALQRAPLYRGMTQQEPGGATCPFLLAGTCAVYLVRPVACRRFLIMRRACGIGENPLETRPQDLLVPSRPVMLEAYARTLPYYEALGETLPETDMDAFLKACSVSLHAVGEKIFSAK